MTENFNRKIIYLYISLQCVTASSNKYISGCQPKQNLHLKLQNKKICAPLKFKFPEFFPQYLVQVSKLLLKTPKIFICSSSSTLEYLVLVSIMTLWLPKFF